MEGLLREFSPHLDPSGERRRKEGGPIRGACVNVQRGATEHTQSVSPPAGGIQGEFCLQLVFLANCLSIEANATLGQMLNLFVPFGSELSHRPTL